MNAVEVLRAQLTRARSVCNS